MVLLLLLLCTGSTPSHSHIHHISACAQPVSLVLPCDRLCRRAPSSHMPCWGNNGSGPAVGCDALSGVRTPGQQNPPQHHDCDGHGEHPLLAAAWRPPESLWAGHACSRSWQHWPCQTTACCWPGLACWQQHKQAAIMPPASWMPPGGPMHKAARSSVREAAGRFAALNRTAAARHASAVRSSEKHPCGPVDVGGLEQRTVLRHGLQPRSLQPRSLQPRNTECARMHVCASPQLQPPSTHTGLSAVEIRQPLTKRCCRSALPPVHDGLPLPTRSRVVPSLRTMISRAAQRTR